MNKLINIKTIVTLIFLFQCILFAKADSFTEIKFYGEYANDRFGTSVSNAGDLNGDGYDDIAIGSPNHNNYKGKVYIYFGGTSVSQNPSYTINGEYDGNNYGFSVSSAGDVNHDGFGDLMVGAWGYNDSVQNYGRAYIYFGGLNFDVTADVIITGEPNEELGRVVSGAGDVNGDGFSDVIIGCPGYFVSPVYGRANIYFGGVNMNNIKDVSLNSMYPSGYANNAVAGVGDLNGDGFSDVIVGAAGINSGRSYIYYGGVNMNNSEDLILYGGVTSVSGTDFNGDGFSDAIVGSWGNAVVFKGAVNMDNDYDFRFRGNYINENIGLSVSDAGDVNGDHYTDFIIGGPIKSEIFIYFGGQNPDTTYDIMKSGESSIDQYGWSVSRAGDINNDGLEDFIVGAAHSQYTGYLAGSAYLYMSNVPVITGVTPNQNAINVTKSTDITAIFGQNMNASTINSSNIKVFGLQTGKLAAAVSYNGANKSATINPNSGFKTGEKIQVTLSSGIRTSDNIPIVPFTWTFTVQALSGTGYFTETAIIDTSIFENQLFRVATGDLDADGDLDIAASGPNIMIYKNNGNGEFSYSQNIDAAVNGGNVMVGDFDGDGDLDIVGNFNDLRLYKNNGGGVFTYAFSSPGGGALGDIGDLDADGDLDIALCSGNQIRWYLNDGDGNFTERSITFFDINEFPPFVINLNVGDMDNDGDMDFTTVVIQIHSPQYTDFKTLYNDGNANFGNATYMSAYFYNSVAADLEGDNDLDILSNTVKYFNNGNGTFTPSAFSSNTNSDIIPADYDGDGDIDAAFTDMSSDKVRLFKNNSAGSLNFFANSTCGNNPNQGTSGDFDGDGDIDLTVINNMGHGDNTSDISLLKNNYNYSPSPLTAILPHPDGDGTLNEVAEFVYEKEYYPNYPNDTIFKPLVCGSNQYIIVDPCNPWVQTFYVAFWEMYPGEVKIQDININWDTTQCQDIRFEYVYPPDPDTNEYSDSIVIKVTMIPHPIDGCIPDSITHPPQPWFEGRGFICPTWDTIYNYNCWLDCLNERLTFTVVDSNPVPNVVTCYLDWDKPLSVELVSFTSAVSGNNVILNWTTSEEKNNKGFTIQRSSDGKWMDIGFVNGKGNSASPADYIFTDRNVNSGLYNYRMKQIDFNGSFEYLILENPVTVGVPDKFTLLQNYPNPFNPTTTIVYGIPKDGHVSLKLYDMNGRDIRTLVNESKTSGYYSIAFSIGDLSSGVYFYKLESGNYIAAKKLVLIK